MILQILFITTGIYLIAGLLFAIPFVVKGVSAIDEGAHDAPWGFRVIIIPGSIVFWPFLLKKWLHKVQQSKHD